MTGGLSFQLDGFERAFPFVLVLGHDGSLVHRGPSWERLAEPPPLQKHWLHSFEMVRPKVEIADGSWAGFAGKLVLLRRRVDGLMVRGELSALDHGLACFFGSPFVKSLEQLRQTGLRISDFAAHDALGDLLFLLQGHRAALDDAKNLSESLSRRSEELRRAARDAERANRAKSAFLAVMSHEIRTPMNGMGSMADLLWNSELTDEQRECVQVLRSCAATLRDIVDDVLDISKIEEDRMELESAPFSPVKLLEETCRIYTQSASDRGIRLHWLHDSSAPQLVLGDVTRVRQVLSNLLTNALKFTDTGSVRVTLQVDDRRASESGLARREPPSAVQVGPEDESDLLADGMLRFVVQDTGCGIPPIAQERVFDAFAQGDVSTTRRFGGTGLGLTICRSLVTMMRGSIELVHSCPSGSTFAFSIPAARAEEVAEVADGGAEAPLEAPPGLEVLVADDNAVNRIVAKKLIEKLGSRAVQAANGREAVTAFESGSFDLVLMDMHMPEMDGLAATAAIRRLEVDRGDPRTPVIAFTADILSSGKQAEETLDFDGVLAKPVRLDELRELFARIAGRKPGPAVV